MTSRIEYNDPKNIGNFSMQYHYEMISDETRVAPFREAVLKNCKNKVVLESGTGTGVFSLIAAKAGAKQVYAIEIDKNIAQFASHNIKKSGFDNIKLLLNDTRKIRQENLDNQLVDVVIAENLSTWFVTEPQMGILNHINEHLAKKDAVRIPASINNVLELTNSKYLFEDIIELRAPYFGFSGITEPKMLSNKILFKSYNFSEINETTVNRSVNVIVTETGVLNSLRLTSPISVCEGVDFDKSDSLMPPVIVPLREDLNVKIGQTVRVTIKYQMNTSWEDFDCYGEILT